VQENVDQLATVTLLRIYNRTWDLSKPPPNLLTKPQYLSLKPGSIIPSYTVTTHLPMKNLIFATNKTSSEPSYKTPIHATRMHQMSNIPRLMPRQHSHSIYHYSLKSTHLPASMTARISRLLLPYMSLLIYP
jgi:hypothetical protein